jgi:hypothetical protein
MTHMQRIGVFGCSAVAIVFGIGIHAQVGDPGTLIKEKLQSQIKVSKASAAHDDVVTAGDVVVLHKDGLMMCSSASAYADSNTYSGGALKADYKNRGKDAAKSAGIGFLKNHIPFAGGGGTSASDAVKNGCTERKFVSGEKFFVTSIDLQKDGILVSTISDPYSDVRYYAEIKFPFPKGAPVPPVDDFVKTVSEVITVQPSDDKGGEQAADSGAKSSPSPSAPGAAAAAPAPMAAIPPPPPPADAPPPTIAIGQTKDAVIAGFGQPVRQAKLGGTKEIFFYKDMKVTFTNGKVSNVE